MKKIIGLSFSMTAAVLALVALFFYRGVPRNTTTVLVLLGIAIAVAVVDIVTSEKLPPFLILSHLLPSGNYSNPRN